MAKDESPSALIDARIAELGDWRGEMLARLRALVHEADPDVVEEWKWRGVPTWSHDGILCTGETYKNVVKMTFAKGASLEDPSGLFNSSLEGNVRRAIDFHEGDKIDEKGVEGAHSRRRGAEHVGAGGRPPSPLPERTKERLRERPPPQWDLPFDLRQWASRQCPAFRRQRWRRDRLPPCLSLPRQEGQRSRDSPPPPINKNYRIE